MISENVYEIGQAYIRLDINADLKFKEAFEKYLLYRGKIYSKQYYKQEYLIDDLYFSIELEDGSLKARLKIFGKIAVGALIAYGGVRTGIDYIIKDAQTVTEHIVEDISRSPELNHRIQRVERRLGVPGKIKRLYNDINKLNNHNENLSHDQLNDLTYKIRRNYEELLFELDQQTIQVIENDINNNRIPINIRLEYPDLMFPRLLAIREEEVRLISEDDINGIELLPHLD